MSKMKQEKQQAISPGATQVSQQTGLTPIQEQAATWLLEKVAEQKTGETNVRAVIRAQCTSGVDDWGTLTHFDDKAYKTECKRLGITPEKL